MNYEKSIVKAQREALAGEKKTDLTEATCIGVKKQVKQLMMTVQVAIVTGGGNFI